jgi:peptide/nickel transport system permease protein
MDSATGLPGATLEELEQLPDYDVQLESLNQWQIAWRRFKRHRMAIIGSTIFLTMVAIGVVGPVLVPYDPNKFPTGFAPPAGSPPSFQHLFGQTGRLHRDVFTLVVNGIRTSLLIGVIASAIGAIVGTIVGGVAGYFGGWLDTILMRIVDALLALPLLFVILAFSQFLGEGHASWFTITMIFALFSWLGIARLVRAVMLSLREEVYVDAARAAGVSDVRIIFRHLIPNSLSPIIVATTLGVAGVIISEAFVSFLGFGVDPTQSPTLGNILSGSLEFINQGNWWWATFPGLAIVLIVLGINFMGDGLRDALDPRAKI